MILWDVLRLKAQGNGTLCNPRYEPMVIAELPIKLGLSSYSGLSMVNDG